MADLISMLAGAAGAGGAPAGPTDPNFENTVLLLHGDGTNGAQNNTFIDSSTNNFTITRNGNTTQGTFTPFSKPDGRWGNFFDGTDDYLIVADNAVLRPGAGAFTLEAWIYRNVSGAAHTIYAKGGASTGINFQVTSGNVLRFTHTTTNIDSTGTIAANTWTHVAVVREGTGTNQTKLYINGTNDGQGTVSTDFTQTEEVRIGTNRSAGDDFNGYISNVRFVKGSALYTGNFTPSTSPFTTTSQGASSSEVELLTCQSNRFLDNSTNAFAVTISGGPRVTPFSPFPLTTAYDPAVNGGAGYFDGSGDYLSIADAAGLRFGTGNFTIQAWIYRSVAGAVHSIAAKGGASTGWVFQVHSDNKLRFTQTTTNIDSTGTIPAGAWTHVAVVREGTGTNQTKLYINGVNDGQATVTTNFNQTEQLNIGADRGNSNVMNGYIAGFKYVVGTAETITVPTAPPTGGTALLNFTNAGIFDNTCFNALETVGDAQIDTTTKKYGTGSIEFDGNGDYLRGIAANAGMNPQSGDYTVEFWAYISSLPGAEQPIVATITSGGTGLLIGLAGGGNVNKMQHAIGNLSVGNPTVVDASNFPTSQWVHVAAVRNSGTIYLYINGTSVGTPTSATGTISQSTITVGAWPPANAFFNGLIDDLRISTIARYTANFTPPTAEFPDIGD